MTERDDEEEIRSLMRELHRAFAEHDVETLDRVLADDFAFTDPRGPVVGKRQWLADIASGELVFDSVEAGDVEFRHLGDHAVVVGRARLRARYTKSDYTGEFEYVGVYRRHGDSWRLELTSARRREAAGGEGA